MGFDMMSKVRRDRFQKIVLVGRRGGETRRPPLSRSAAHGDYPLAGKGDSPAIAMKASGHSQMKTFLRYVNQSSESVFEFAMRLDRVA